MCYVIADYGDFLGLIDHTTGKVHVIGKVVPPDGENLAIKPDDFTIYNIAGENTDTPLITIDDQTVTTTIINPNLGLEDVDALTFDPRSGTLYAVAVDPNPGVVYTIDPFTGNKTHVVDLQFPSPNPLAGKFDPHIDGIAIDPDTGVMYGAYSAWASKSYLVTIDLTTGELTLVGGPPGDPGYTGVDDIEDIAFHPAGNILYGVLGSEGAIGGDSQGSFEGLVIIDKSTAAATPVGTYGPALQGVEDGRWDIEAFACSVPLPRGRIGDFVWADTDGDGLHDPGETQGIAHVPLHVTGVNVLSETVDITVTTSVTGYYVVEDLLPGTYTVTAPSSYGGFVRTSTSPLTTTLAIGHMEDLSLDFGYIAPTGFQIIRFEARVEGGRVILEWAVRILSAEPSFYVWRSQGNAPEIRLTDTPVSGHTISGNEVLYNFVDENVRSGQTYWYWLQTRDGMFYGPWVIRVRGQSSLYLPFLRR